MSHLLTRPARLLRRAAMGGLACLAVLFAARLAGSAGSREGVTEEVVHEVGERIEAMRALASGAPDLPAAPVLPASGPSLPAFLAAPSLSPAASPATTPRAPTRARPVARGPPVRA
jgi:hypothetical protein